MIVFLCAFTGFLAIFLMAAFFLMQPDLSVGRGLAPVEKSTGLRIFLGEAENPFCRILSTIWVERMKIPLTRNAIVAFVGFWFGLMSVVCAADKIAPGWNPSAFRDESTLQVMTVGEKEGEHWSKLWLVVIDGKLYVRLGDRSFERVQKNVASPYVKLKIAGQRFDRVRVEATPEMAEKVAAAMADKYFLDILVRHESHPMTARLVAEPASPQ